MRTIAPAKINWTLEVLGRREDGYHEIRSVMQTIDLLDTVEVWPADENSLEVVGDYAPGKDDLALRAAQLVAHRQFGIRLTKRVPVGSGLGGGSSDAAAVLRAIDKMIGSRDYDPTQDADELGSDVPFFLQGGTALVRGRGDVIEDQVEVPETWLVLVIPPFSVAEKTTKMYETLRESEFGEGWRSSAFMHLIKYRQPIDNDILYNAFDAAAERVFPGIGQHWRAFQDAGARAAHLCGAGPAMFSPALDEADAIDLATRVRAPGSRVLVAKTLPAREATAVTD